jgi:hypothetical protein
MGQGYSYGELLSQLAKAKETKKKKPKEEKPKSKLAE